MINYLPSDLKESEIQIIKSLEKLILEGNDKRLSINLKFEGLRLMPIVIRLVRNLNSINSNVILLCPDAGATALAKRDASDLANQIFSFTDYLNNKIINREEKCLVALSPQHYDYDQYESICDIHKDLIIMFNGKLEDFAVGVGSVGRERRKGFISKWLNTYWLEPLSEGALLHIHPDNWKLFKKYDDGYRLAQNYENKPNPETIMEDLI